MYNHICNVEVYEYIDKYMAILMYILCSIETTCCVLGWGLVLLEAAVPLEYPQPTNLT